MPIIEVNLFEGRSAQQKQDLIVGLTQATALALGVPTDNIRIIIRELEKENFGIGGKTALELGR